MTQRKLSALERLCTGLLKVGGIYYKMVPSPGMSKWTGSLGTMSRDAKQIHVDIEVDPVGTVLHEVIHTIERVMGMTPDEKMVETIEHHVRALLCDNLDRVRALCDCIELEQHGD